MRILLVSLFMLFCDLAVAENLRFIQVTGNGEIKATPDYLQVNLSIQATENNLKAAKKRVDRAMKQLLSEAQKLDINETDIDAAHISNQSQYEWRGNQQEYRGEQVTRNISITLLNKDNYADLAHQLLMIKEVRIYGSQLKFNNRQQLKNQALTKAIEAAKNKAQLMANAADNKLGKVLHIQEQGSHIPQPRFAGAEVMAMEASLKQDTAPMLIQKQKITATVVVRYELN